MQCSPQYSNTYHYQAPCRGRARRYNSPARYMQSITNKHAEEPAEKRATPYGSHALPPRSEAAHFQKYMYEPDVLCSVNGGTV